MRKLHDLLKEKRTEKNLTLEEVEKATKIKKKYLEAIEEGKFHSLPSESYARGFVRNYALYLGIPEYKIDPLFRRDYKGKQIDFVPKFRKNQHRFSRRSLFSGRGLLIMGSVLLVAIFVIFQYSSLFLSPTVDLTIPQNGEVIDGNVIQVKGKTDPAATVTVNGDAVYVGLDGKFSKSLYAFSGDQKIIIEARNRFGKQTKKILTVKVK